MLRTGVRLGLDLGKARIGVARSDHSGAFVLPVTTLKAAELAKVADLVAEYEPIEIIIGLPRALNGREELAASQVREVAGQLAELLPQLPIRMVDERMSTVSAARALSAAGKDTRAQRSLIDQAAAVEILQQALDIERNTGQAAGEPLQSTPGGKAVR